MQNQIKCPHCGKEITIDESDYESIIKQIKDHQFEEELEKQVKLIKEKVEADAKTEAIRQQQNEQALQQKLAAIKSENKLKEQQAEVERELKIKQAVSDKERELEDARIEVQKLKSEIQLMNSKQELQDANTKQRYEDIIRLKDEEIQHYKDFKAKQSTKMVGESLEQYCHDQFNKIRMTAFPNAYFEKDNAISKTGSKGDFIFREEMEGVELVSIMFEMKNQNETTASKHKNEDFFKELDKDRNEKGCEYAVLVSMLEEDSDYYNTGIVDVSYRYPKMYVIRPQFFIPMITLLRNSALNAMSARREVVALQNKQVDIVNFETEWDKFQESVSKNYNLAKDKYQDAIKQIENSIKALETTRDFLMGSEKNLAQIDKKTQAMSVKKLVKNSPVLKKELEENQKDGD
jgi:hypothetical protein